MNKEKIGLLLLTMGFFATAADAGKIAMKPGMWRWQSQMEIPGMPMQMPPSIHQECLTEKEMVPGNGDPSQECKIHDVKITSGRVDWQVTCNTPDGISTGKGTMQYAGDQAHGRMEMTSQGMRVQIKMTGKHLGECKGG